MEKLIFEYSKKGRRGYSLPEEDLSDVSFPEAMLRKEDARLPEVSEVDVVRHYTKLSTENFGVDSGFYPLGSCTMKYNPKVNEKIAALPELTALHPLQSEDSLQGILEILYDLEQQLCDIFGYAGFSLQPAAGAHGEFVGLLLIRTYHLKNGDNKRKKILVPDSSHGTNPASCTSAGFSTIVIKSDENGRVDLDDLKNNLDDEVAGLMLTNPNTLGLFDKNILEVSKLVHDAGGLLYYDGANANATMGIARPGDIGFDVCHINLHKTFSTPHGGGGPGSGPVGVSEKLLSFLPNPVIKKDGERYSMLDLPDSVGKVHAFYGNVGVAIKAYCYIKSLGSKGLKEVSEIAVLNANYIRARLKDHYDIPYDTVCKHEFVISVKNIKKEFGITATDIAKRLIDYGFHPPTIYFPLNVPECLMIEPTETESKETLDSFCDAMIEIRSEIETEPDVLKSAPNNTEISRLDEVKAVKDSCLNYFSSSSS